MRVRVATYLVAALVAIGTGACGSEGPERVSLHDMVQGQVRQADKAERQLDAVLREYGGP